MRIDTVGAMVLALGTVYLLTGPKVGHRVALAVSATLAFADVGRFGVSQSRPALLDHLVSDGEQERRHREDDNSGGLVIDD